MRDIQEIKALLEHIANALDKIVEHLEQNPSQKSISSGSSQEIQKSKDIKKFLSERGVTIKTLPASEPADEFLDRIAFFMGDRFSHIKELYTLLKKNLSFEYPFRLELKDKTQEEISTITQLCSQLHQIAFLEEYTYLKSPKFILYAKVNKIPKAINFFTGGWLERYIKSAVIKALERLPRKVEFSYIKNSQVVLPDGKDFELDLLFKIGDEFYWFEAKTGDYQRYVEKYSKVAKVLGLDQEHAFMILTDITEAGAEVLCSLFGMKVVQIDRFFEFFHSNMHRRFGGSFEVLDRD